MKTGDKVRFLNDVGGGTVTGFRQGGIVLVEDADGFDIPMPQSEVVVIEEEAPKAEKRKAAPKVEYGTTPLKEPSQEGKSGNRTSEKPEVQSLNGRDYLKSKTVQPSDSDEDGLDEQLEARMVRLEMALQKVEAALLKVETALQQQEARIARLEAENNLRKNEKLMARQAKQQKKPQPPANIGELNIL